MIIVVVVVVTTTINSFVVLFNCLYHSSGVLLLSFLLPIPLWLKEEQVSTCVILVAGCWVKPQQKHTAVLWPLVGPELTEPDQSWLVQVKLPWKHTDSADFGSLNL